MSLQETRDTIKKIYNTKCGGKKDGIDNCNCFLHSFGSKVNINGPVYDIFDSLEPFVIYIYNQNIGEITLIKLKEHARNFNDDILTFEGCNW